MKPRTKIQKEADTVFRKMYGEHGTDMSESFVNWVWKKVARPVAYWSGKRAWCSECGEGFDHVGGSLLNAFFPGKVTCPHCGALLTVKQTRKRTDERIVYVQDFAIAGKWQIVNTYSVEILSKKGISKRVSICRVFSRMYSDDEHFVTLSVGLKMNAYLSRNPWNVYSLEGLRVMAPNANYGGDAYSGWDIKGAYPYSRIHPRYRKKGVSCNLHGIDMNSLLTTLNHSVHSSKAETFLKAKQFELLEWVVFSSMSESCWRSTKVALRHGFNFRKINVGDWIDLLRNLQYLGLDTMSPKYICPKNFKKFHDEILSRANRKSEREKNENDKKRAAAFEAEYLKNKGKYLGIVIEGNGIRITPLQSVAEFIAEADAMHHCVYANRYFKKSASLILTARSEDGNRLETVEVNLESFKVLQSRSVCNGSSPRHDDILELMQKNMSLIRACSKKSA